MFWANQMEDEIKATQGCENEMFKMLAQARIRAGIVTQLDVRG